MNPTGHPQEFPTEFPKAASASAGGTITGTTTVDGSPASANLILAIALPDGSYVDATTSVLDGGVYKFSFTDVPPNTYDIWGQGAVNRLVEGIVITGSETVDVGNLNQSDKE